MAINFDALMTWREFKVLGREEQHDYLQYLVDAYGANAVSFAKMFQNLSLIHISEPTRPY